MATPEIRIYDALKPALGEESAKEFIEALDESMVAKIEFMKQDLATKGDIIALKDDIAAVKDEIAALRLATKDDIAELRSATKKDIEELRLGTKGDIAELRLAMEKMRSENKWTAYILSLVQLIAIIGSVIAILKASK